MKSSIIFSLAVLCLSLTGKPSAVCADGCGPGDTIHLRFVPLQMASDDKTVSDAMLRRLRSASHDGEVYTAAKIIHLPDSTGIKILNVYGEVTGGATYNPFAVSYIIRNDAISASGIPGEIFRVDVRKNDTYLLYTDNFWRLGSVFKVYDARVTQDGIIGYQTQKHGNYLFDSMHAKSHSADSLPMQHHDENADWLLQLLGVDKAGLTSHEFYWTEDAPFLDRISSDENEQIAPMVYYRQSKGDITEKMLWFKRDGQVTKRLLAMRADDPYERVSTTFVNDSVFREYYSVKEMTEEQQDMIAYDVDSVVTDYRYDRYLNFTEIKKTAFAYRSEIVSENNARVSERRIVKGKPFVMNGQQWYWEFVSVRPYEQNMPLPYVNFTRSLFNTSSGQMVFALPPATVTAGDEDFSDRAEDFSDVNLDGYADGKFYDANASGSAGNFDNVYLYNQKTRTFEHSELFSGYDINTDSHNRIVYSYGKSGYYNFSIGRIFLDKQSRVRFVEVFTCDDDKENLVLRYRKSKGGKTIGSKVSVVAIEKFGSREAVEEALFGLAE